jgi:small conductance mechanosensitive channel
MADAFLARLPSLALGLIVFSLFYAASSWTSLRSAGWSGHYFVGFPGLLFHSGAFLPGCRPHQDSWHRVAIGFAFQNILQNFLAGLLLLWTEPFRVGDQIRLDPFEGTVEDIQTRATTIRTYDGRRVLIPNADLFTRSFTINTAFDSRRWDAEIAVSSTEKDLMGLKSRIVDTVSRAEGVLREPAPEALVVGLGDQMVTTYDHVLTAITMTLAEGEPQAEQPRAA